ncbi:uncharacterized protein LOC117331574 [Pecten maximus]|uniref:uncharacterized protein LOC117331574 n=1 Tax=Pecten maximus TaxID=6579 RepID=UPI001458BC7D|nr:uncharacterized protein LOC117331574 [Pecten maximus]XP_033746263.1 uncharacterized protein LOC117331574 [Pecten maximus]XP_033746264.1 uncharacterized protein LOC117331574 [Pecten maximus]XP_033746265.1 uncharacterized protein LOC117331574 [Pecten maximus]XP_033746266.1 uncharacterized protein LOC117331574 [Pecten maximus]XP_033746268.1 uncharacterized protein LOC117331574 [Pecten maximus]XP_033746269.1 uncharacterized protein LOC117331574 [Pecten maximus]
MAPVRVTSIFLSVCIGTVVSDCSYLHKHYDNETATYREDTLYKTCLRTEECCGNYTDRKCCSVLSQKKSAETESYQHAPALLLAGITSALVVIGIIAIICWRLVCISAYKEASVPHDTDDNTVDSPRQQRRRATNRGHHHGLHGHNHRGLGHNHLGHHQQGHGHHHRVHVADEHLTGPHPPAYTRESAYPPSKYIAPPSYEDSMTIKETDPPPAYTFNVTETGDRTYTCSDHMHGNVHQDEETERPRGQTS